MLPKTRKKLDLASVFKEMRRTWIHAIPIRCVLNALMELYRFFTELVFLCVFYNQRSVHLTISKNTD